MIKRVGTVLVLTLLRQTIMTPDPKLQHATLSSNPLTIYPAGCKQQADDIATLLHAIDDFGATALALSSKSGQGYSMFIDARDNIRSQIEHTFEKYRLVKEAA